MRPAAVIFEAELRRRAIQFATTLDGRYQLEFGGGTVVLNLDNVSRDFERDGDPDRIVRYIDSSLGIFAALPPWEQVRSRIYWSLESSDSDFDTALFEKVTETVSRVLVFAALDEGRIQWLTPKCENAWQVGLDELRAAAAQNLDDLLGSGRLRVESANGRKLGMLEIDSPLKASLIFAPALKNFVEADLGWPILAVIPSRDFIYVFGEGDDVLNVVGEVVQEEFRTSGYPVTTEVLRISDAGIEAVGHFPK